MRGKDVGYADNGKGAVALWCEWQQQETGISRQDALQDFLTVQVSLDSRTGEEEEAVSLAHLRHWLQVCDQLPQVHTVPLFWLPLL